MKHLFLVTIACLSFYFFPAQSSVTYTYIYPQPVVYTTSYTYPTYSYVSPAVYPYLYTNYFYNQPISEQERKLLLATTLASLLLGFTVIALDTFLSS